MKYAALLLLVCACSRQEAVTVTTDTREPLGVWYVGAPELQIRAKPADDAPVVTTYQNGEAVSVLVRQGDWVEVRTAMGSGWARFADLATAAQAKAEEDNPQPKFRRPAMPVAAPGARGEIYIEADVNTDGEVTSTRLITDTTKNPNLVAQNIAALQNAKFYPIVIKGERKPFKYYHRVTY